MRGGGFSFSGGFRDTLTNVSANIFAFVSYFQFIMTMTQSQTAAVEIAAPNIQCDIQFRYLPIFLESLLFYKEVLPKTMKKEHYYSFLNRQEQKEDPQFSKSRLAFRETHFVFFVDLRMGQF